MSFLSRRPSRSGNREVDAGRDDEYDDYDYAPDGYRGDEDENWSPGEYFSPEGIKGRWADGQRPGERAAARGRRGDVGRGDSGRGDPGRGDSGQAYQDQAAAGYEDNGYGDYGTGGYPSGYGTGEYATGAYDLPEGADEDRGERGGRRRKERGSRLRLGRRDRGEEIWPDDGVSDEDYWASVASDRPLNGVSSPVEADLPPAADSRPTGRPGGHANNDDHRAAAGSRPGADPRAAGDQRFGDDHRGSNGRLGPPPGLAGDYQPGAGGNSGSGGSSSTVNTGRAGSGPMAGYAPSGGARPGTGPMAARPSTGPISAWSSQAGYPQSGTGPRPSFQPGGGPAASRPAGGRPSAPAADWGERTERIDRVNAAGYPEPRSSGRGQAPGRPGAPTGGPASDPFSATGAPGAPARGRIDAGRQDNGRTDLGRTDNGRIDNPDWRTPDRREQGRDADRALVRTTGGWAAVNRGLPAADRGGDRPGADDPLTSTAYSRATTSESDGRSYRVAARRSQAQAKLTEETQVFGAPTGYPSDQHRTGQYETGDYPAPAAARGGQYRTGVTGEYPTGQHRPTSASGVTGVTGKSAADQYRTGEYPTGDYRTGQYQTGEYPTGDYRTGEYPTGGYRTGEYPTGEYSQHRADPQASAGRYPGYPGSQPGSSGQPGSGSGSGAGSSQPGRRGQPGPVGPGALNSPSGPNSQSGPNRFGGQPAGNSGRVSLPNAAVAPSGQYPVQQPRLRERPQSQPPQPQSQPTQSPSSRQAVQPQLPATGAQGGHGQGSGSPTGGSAAGAPVRPQPASGGRDPYESAVTGSYPYPSQPYPARPGPAGNRTSGANPALEGRDGRVGRDDRYYRPTPAPADGYDPGRDGNDGYGAPRDRRY
jgi:hypothetical protein